MKRSLISPRANWKFLFSIYHSKWSFCPFHAWSRLFQARLHSFKPMPRILHKKTDPPTNPADHWINDPQYRDGLPETAKNFQHSNEFEVTFSLWSVLNQVVYFVTVFVIVIQKYRSHVYIKTKRSNTHRQTKNMLREIKL